MPQRETTAPQGGCLGIFLSRNCTSFFRPTYCGASGVCVSSDLLEHHHHQVEFAVLSAEADHIESLICSTNRKSVAYAEAEKNQMMERLDWKAVHPRTEAFFQCKS